jgi:hypothetical protein
LQAARVAICTVAPPAVHVKVRLRVLMRGLEVTHTTVECARTGRGALDGVRCVGELVCACGKMQPV